MTEEIEINVKDVQETATKASTADPPNSLNNHQRRVNHSSLGARSMGSVH
jgi:hypothetical protein